MKILLVEADRQFADRVQVALVQQHYFVDLALDGETGWQLADGFTYDLLLLDLSAPGLDGLRFCRQRRQQGDRTPILLLASGDSSTDKAASLDAGADDCLSKPCDLDELLARCRALLRRGGDEPRSELVWGELRLDPQKCQVFYAERPLKLTAKEYELLELFLRYPQRIFSQSNLLDRLWSFDDPPTENAVRTQIKSLRSKLKRAGAGDPIETIYGLGYRLRESTSVQAIAQCPGGILAAPPAPNPKLAELWERQKPKYLERLGTIEQAAAALQAGALPPALHEQARREAHTLAGSLGSFGLGAASAAARSVEACLESESPEPAGLFALLSGLRQALLLGRATAAAPTVRAETGELGRSLLIVDDDAALTAAVALEAEQWGWQVRSVESPADALVALAQQQPDAILLDLGFPESADAGFEVLAAMTAEHPHVPVVAFTAKQQLVDRVKVARLGGVGFLQKPIAPAEVMQALVQAIAPPPQPEAQVLAASGDRELLAQLERLLVPWGLPVTGAANSDEFWPQLRELRPDLLILDVDLPQFSGLDLCSVVRNEPQWCHLPILIAIERANTACLSALFSAGADDYVGKPLIAPELLARALNCLERHQRGARRWAIPRR